MCKIMGHDFEKHEHFKTHTIHLWCQRCGAVKGLSDKEIDSMNIERLKVGLLPNRWNIRE